MQIRMRSSLERLVANLALRNLSEIDVPLFFAYNKSVIDEIARKTTEGDTMKKRELHVDGHTHKNGGLFDGGGRYPPFVVFDADKQENIAGPFNTRAEARDHLREILKGAEPKLDAVALGEWIERIDNGNN
jgi:hypothetical protein